MTQFFHSRPAPGGSLTLFALLSAMNTHAQGPFTSGPMPVRHQLGISLSVEPELTTSLGYTYGLAQPTNSLQVRLGAGITLPPYRVSSGSGRINGLVAVDWRTTERNPPLRWGGRLALLPFYARNHNEAGTMDGLGLELRLMPLHRGERWTNGLDLGWQGTLLTHIRHSERAKAAFEERYVTTAGGGFTNPNDGWYWSTAHRFRLGYTGGRRLGDSVNWQFSVGTLLALQRQGVLLSFAHGQVPVYLETAFSVDW